jgi:hypothetical protein
MPCSCSGAGTRTRRSGPVQRPAFTRQEVCSPKPQLPRSSPFSRPAASSAHPTSGTVGPDYRVLMNAGHVPPPVAGPTRRPANFGSGSEPAGLPRPAKRGNQGPGRHRSRPPRPSLGARHRLDLKADACFPDLRKRRSALSSLVQRNEPGASSDRPRDDNDTSGSRGMKILTRQGSPVRPRSGGSPGSGILVVENAVGHAVLDDGLRARAFRWRPLRLARVRCERESSVSFAHSFSVV